jgi:hypothetical protein
MRFGFVKLSFGEIWHGKPVEIVWQKWLPLQLNEGKGLERVSIYNGVPNRRFEEAHRERYRMK